MHVSKLNSHKKFKFERNFIWSSFALTKRKLLSRTKQKTAFDKSKKLSFVGHYFFATFLFSKYNNKICIKYLVYLIYNLTEPNLVEQRYEVHKSKSKKSVEVLRNSVCKALFSSFFFFYSYFSGICIRESVGRIRRKNWIKEGMRARN